MPRTIRTLILEVTIFKPVIHGFYKVIQAPHDLYSKALNIHEHGRVQGSKGSKGIETLTPLHGF